MKANGKIRRIPLFDLKVSAQAKKEVNRTLRAGWLTTGPGAAALEKAVAQLLEVENAVAVSSDTMGLQLALRAVGAGPDKEVITTPFTFVATIEAIIATGARPVLADIDPVSLTIDPDEVTRKISGRTAAVVPVDIAGHPADYRSLRAVCRDRGIPLVADAAHAIGTRYRGRSMAHWADAAVYSFYSTKNLTCGEGGLVASKDKKLVETVRTLSRHGLTSNAFFRHKKGEWQYDVMDVGAKGNLSDIHAAIGLGQLAVFEKYQAQRRRSASRYDRNLSNLGMYLDLPQEPATVEHGWHLYIIKLHPERLGIDRNAFIRSMAGFGIECGVHYQPLFEFPFYRKALGISRKHFPNAAYAGRRVVSLPLYPGLKAADVDYVCDCVRRVVNKEG